MSDEIIKLYKEEKEINPLDEVLIFRILEEEDGIYQNIDKPFIINSENEENVSYEFTKNLEAFEKYGGIEKALELSANDFVSYLIERIKSYKNKFYSQEGNPISNLSILLKISSSLKILSNFSSYGKISKSNFERIKTCLLYNGTNEELAYLAKVNHKKDPELLQSVIEKISENKNPIACCILAEIDEVDKTQFINIIEDEAQPSEVVLFAKKTNILTPKMKEILVKHKSFNEANELYEFNKALYTIDELQNLAILTHKSQNIIKCMKKQGADLDLLLRTLYETDIILAYEKQLELGNKVENLFESEKSKNLLISSIIFENTILSNNQKPIIKTIKSKFAFLISKIVPKTTKIGKNAINLIQKEIIEDSNFKSNWLFNVKDANVMNIVKSFNFKDNKTNEITLENYWDTTAYIHGMIYILSNLNNDKINYNFFKENDIIYTDEAINNIKEQIKLNSQLYNLAFETITNIISFFEKLERPNGSNIKIIQKIIEDNNLNLTQIQK